jgi:serine phosphatase RsbU (regulator of sigma subunit)/integral membrane sensor domain MASE1/anti-sigma regulatory factor (Ser/Thr protein kinase)
MIAMRSMPRGEYAVRLAIVAVAYLVAAELGLRFAVVADEVTPLWPPTGVAIVALLAFGPRIWPAIAVSAFAVNVPIGPSVAAAVLIGAGNTLAPVVAALVLARVGFRIHLERVRDALALVFIGALGCMAISATVGATTLLVAGAIEAREYVETWSAWWAGDAMGVLIVAPFLWSLRRPRFDRVRWDRVAEAAALFAALAIACLVAVHNQEELLFLVLPLLGWIAWRFQQQGAAPAALLVSVVVIAAAADDIGPFAGESLLSQMILLQTFNASVAFTTLLFASAVSERQRLVEREQGTQRALYQREHRVATTLQRSLLPEHLPETIGLAVASRYLPATTDVAIGGDWYDIIALGDGRLGLVIGDVAGHGVNAAATMGQIRMALRAYAVDDLSPAEALGRLNRLMRELQPGAMATVLYAHLDPGTRDLRFANAGHPPPLLIIGPHNARFLEDGRAPPVGVSSHVAFCESSVWIEPGATLLLYTDGLVERRSEPIDERLRLLQRTAGESPDDLEATCDHLIRTLLDEGPADDVALLAVRPLSLAGATLLLSGPALPETVSSTRRSIAHWLRENGVGRDPAFDVMVASTEAYTNAVLHAYGMAEGTVELEAVIERGTVKVTICDGGTWRHPADGHDGCGLMMMRALMDSVEFETSSKGTRVTMTRDAQSPVGDG